MSLNEIVKTMQDAVNRQTDQAKPGGYDTTATVRRIEGDTAFVHIPGGVDETPVKLTINAKAGDNVQVRVSGGSAFLVGNGSAPPTDDARANQAYTVATVAEGAAENALANAARAAEAADSAQASATRAEGAANDAVIAAGDAQTAAGNAQTAADTALVNLATTEDVVGVLNWITAHGTMTTQSGGVFVPGHVYFILDPAGDYVVGGNHYSVVPEPKADDIDSYYVLTVDESVQNYVATHIVVDSEGLWIIPDAGGNKVLIATGSGSTYTTAGTYIIGKVNNVDTVFAQFTTNGMTTNATSGTQIAHLGYGPGKNAGGGTSDKPYYTFGIRPNGSTVGNYSVAEGSNSTASGYSSHAEGGSIASGVCAHAEGDYSKAAGDSSHAEGNITEASAHHSHSEGNRTTASGQSSHAEGSFSESSGTGSHAQNLFTKASKDGQTALGTYNVEDTSSTTTHPSGASVYGKYAAIIGNGTADNARSNALTVDWSGNTDQQGRATTADMTAQEISDFVNTVPTGFDNLTNLSVTNHLAAGGDITAGGDVTDGAGNTLSSVASDLSSLIVCEMKPLATNVSVGAGADTSQYTIPSKTGYKVAAVTPIVTGSYWGHYFAIFGAQNSMPAYVYFKNTHTSAHTNSFYAYVMYIKD